MTFFALKLSMLVKISQDYFAAVRCSLSVVGLLCRLLLCLLYSAYRTIFMKIKMTVTANIF